MEKYKSRESPFMFMFPWGKKGSVGLSVFPVSSDYLCTMELMNLWNPNLFSNSQKQRRQHQGYAALIHVNNILIYLMLLGVIKKDLGSQYGKTVIGQFLICCVFVFVGGWLGGW